MLRDSVDKFVSDNCGVERHRHLCTTQLGYDAAQWQQFADLGWLGVPFSEEYGGIGGGATDLMVMAEALGRGLVREPYLATVVTCGGFLRHAGNARQCAQYIPEVIAGSTQWAFACAEKNSGYSLERIDTTAQLQGEDYLLRGEKTTVLNGHCADFFVVSAKISEAEGLRGGLTLFIVDATLPGITRQPFVAVDGSSGATVQLQDVLIGADQVLGTVGQGLSLMEAVIDEAIVALGGEALGAMQSLLDATVEYTSTRQQFGQPISKFQVLQHRMADMYLKIEETRSLLFNAAIQLEEGSAQAASACAALKVKVSEASRYVAQEAVQLHGGIGMTDELCVGHHYKRLMLLSRLYGDEAYYLQKYADLSAAGVA